MSSLKTVMNTAYTQTAPSDRTALLNNADLFLQRIAQYYDPSMKDECKLLEKAIRQGAGNIVSQYLLQGEVPDRVGTDTFITELRNRAGFDFLEAKTIVDDLYYMVNWPSVDELSKPQPAPKSDPTRNIWVMTIVLYLLWIPVLYLLTLIKSDGTAGTIIWIIIAVTFATIGYKSITKIQPQMFVFMPVVGWLVYFAVKVGVGLFVGIFLTPYKLAQKIVNRA